MLIFLQINLSIPLMQLNAMHIVRYFEILDAFKCINRLFIYDYLMMLSASQAI